MTKRKFTDEQIIKALECCTSPEKNTDCSLDCPYGGLSLCEQTVMAHALALLKIYRSELESVVTSFCLIRKSYKAQKAKHNLLKKVLHGDAILVDRACGTAEDRKKAKCIQTVEAKLIILQELEKALKSRNNIDQSDVSEVCEAIRRDIWRSMHDSPKLRKEQITTALEIRMQHDAVFREAFEKFAEELEAPLPLSTGNIDARSIVDELVAAAIAANDVGSNEEAID